MLIAMQVFLVAVSACAGSGVAVVSAGSDLGSIPIGGTPSDAHIFVVSDCEHLPDRYADCSAQDAEGRRYAFFEGALAKVWVTRAEAARALRLPAALEFGEDIERAAETVAKAYGIKLDRAPAHDGRTVYSSDFVLKSSAGVMYSIELVADEKGRLVEVAERTDL